MYLPGLFNTRFGNSGGGAGATGLINDGADITVADFASLPPAADNNDKVAIVLASTGVQFVNKKYAGTYVSNGSAWLLIEETSGEADSIDYDNTVSGLTATDVQAAIDEIAAGGGGGSGNSYFPSGW